MPDSQFGLVIFPSKGQTRKIKGNLPNSFCSLQWTGDWGYCSWRIFHNMNFTQMHERLRLELLRRIQRGTLSVSLLARQTGLGQSHMSNFLRSRRHLSLEALDRVLLSQHMSLHDLLPLDRRITYVAEDNEADSVPLVSHAAALFEPLIRLASIRTMIRIPQGRLRDVRWRTPGSRRGWRRFVAVSISAADALAMDPVVQGDALVVLDRHYNSLFDYRPRRSNVYAVRNGNRLVLRYADFLANRLVLRPRNLEFPVDLLEIPPGETPGDLIAGRIVLIMNEA